MQTRLALLILFIPTIFFLAPLEAENRRPEGWPQWRGPGMQGYSSDTSIPLTWSEKENLAWKTSLPGTGNSTPIIWGDRIFLTSSSDNGKERHVICVGAKDGKILWQQTAASAAAGEKTHAWNGFASPSCVTDGKHVYAFFGTPGLFCYDMDGKKIWQHTFGIFTSEAGWGTAASPFLFENLVIQNCDNDGEKGMRGAAGTPAPESLVALDKSTGKVVWETPRNQGRGFSTPCLIPAANGRIDLVLNGPKGVYAYDPKTGKERWHCDRSDSKDQSRFGEPMPVFDGSMLFVVSGRPGPCQGIRMPDQGDVTRSHVLWESVRKGHRDVGSPILVDGLLYSIDNKATLTCTELKTGKELYNERLGTGKSQGLASPVYVKGKLLFVLDDGLTVVVEPGPQFKIAARNRLGKGDTLEFGASPAISEGQLFLRSQSTLYCIQQGK